MLLDLNDINVNIVKNDLGKITKVLLVVDLGNNSNDIVEFSEVSSAVHYLKHLELEMIEANRAASDMMEIIQREGV